jgi:hypothetical protein
VPSFSVTNFMTDKTNSNPVDAVITWVDGSDPVLTEKRNFYLSQSKDIHLHETQPTFYASNNEIKYCVLSIFKFAPFIRNIYIITDGQVPDIFQDVENKFPGRTKSIKIVDHKEIYRGYEHFLPVFNITSILTMIWNIDGLSDNFVFFNDDFFLIRDIKKEDWFVNGRPVMRGKWLLPPYKKLAGNFWKTIKNKYLIKEPDFKPKLSFYIRQWNTAKLLGFKYRYFFHCHTPHPLNRKTIERFFIENRELFENNMSSRFKNQDQFILTSLVYHLEIKEGNRNFRKLDHCYLHPFYSNNKIMKKISRSKFDAEIKSVCAQNLDIFEPQVRKRVFEWMDDVLGI